MQNIILEELYGMGKYFFDKRYERNAMVKQANNVASAEPKKLYFGIKIIFINKVIIAPAEEIYAANLVLSETLYQTDKFW